MKLKVAYEFDAIILKVHQAGKAWNYTVGYAIPQDKVDQFTPVVQLGSTWYGVLGKTFNTNIRGKVGQIINIAALEFKKTKQNNKTKYTLFQARVLTLKPSLKQPDSYIELDRLAVEPKKEESK
ncbi:MAG: hypothetical protein DRP09_13110 [Candidatus Thorarchaeota archaeon]|nr:MAG: hypothetical protein DRP09_13110 [Candidatus Thorarchaeota archaeon]